MKENSGRQAMSEAGVEQIISEYRAYYSPQGDGDCGPRCFAKFYYGDENLFLFSNNTLTNHYH